MGGCRCSYKNCLRATNNSEKDFHFFHYPVKNPSRCSQWIANANKPKFQLLPEEQLRNKVVCELHFEPENFTNVTKKRLVHNAVPTLDAGSEDSCRKEPLNVQILQSDSDGNVFTVDTDNLMNNEVGDVPSYVIQNGNLVPAYLSNGKLKPLIYKFSVSSHAELYLENDAVNNNEQEFTTTKSKTMDFNFGTHKQWPESVNNNFKYMDKSVTICGPQDPLELSESVDLPNILIPVPSYDAKNIEQTIMVEDEEEPQEEEEELNTMQDSNSIEVANLSKTIQQHSKEIAHLKRLINTKMKRVGSNKRMAKNRLLSNLRGLLPSTLYGAVALHLSKKCDNFSKDEKQFLITLYNASPAVYEILVKDCKWKLPGINTVKKLSY